MIKVQERIADAMNDRLLQAALPSLERFVGPLLAEMRGTARTLLLGEQPKTLRAHLSTLGDITEEEATLVWRAVGLAVSDG